MMLLTGIATAFVATLHVLFLLLEMFLWDKPFGRKTFGLSVEEAATTKVLAANQGLYNGFLAAGLFWSLFTGRVATMAFFLICVVVAGLFGGATVSNRIWFIQALPAAIALLFLALR